LTPEKKVYILLNKPKNFTALDEGQEFRNVLELVKGLQLQNWSCRENGRLVFIVYKRYRHVRKFTLPTKII
jgi:23S rRNA pseudouridine2605 synthase